MKGIYALVIGVPKDIVVDAGVLRHVQLRKGFYVYVGSAQTSIEKRIARHLRKTKKRFWHIDYLLSARDVSVVGVFHARGPKSRECEVARRLNGVGIAVKGFGSSDCHCPSHLFRVENYEFLRDWMNELAPARGARSMQESGWCVWITGLPGSGKSAVSEALLVQLRQKGVRAQLLSSDKLRKVVTPEPTYSLEERDMLYSTLTYVAKLLAENGVNVVIDATGNLRRYREKARQEIPRFMEAYLKCPIRVCMKREAKRSETYSAPKGIYVRAMKGEASTVPGIGQPYERPLSPEITLDAAKLTPEECAQRILRRILLELRKHRNLMM
jgi:adenylylsulfate kinase